MKFLRRLHDLYRGDVEPDWHSDRCSILVALLLVILTGPLIFLTYAIQDWCARSHWDYEDRWNGTKAFAVTFLLAYLPLIIFRGVLAQFWPHFVGAPDWNNPLLWWCWCIPLSPALALLSERVDPRTKPLERILLPSELPPQQLAHAEEKASPTRTARRKQSAANPNESRTASPVARKRKKKRDQRPVSEAWAGQQLVLPHPSSDVPSKTSPASSTRSARQAKKDERDEGESLKDIF
jgi:hypothetical protein